MCSINVVELLLEPCPKWKALKDVLAEIEKEHESATLTPRDKGRVLVVVEDDRTCTQLHDVRVTFSVNLSAH